MPLFGKSGAKTFVLWVRGVATARARRKNVFRLSARARETGAVWINKVFLLLFVHKKKPFYHSRGRITDATAARRGFFDLRSIVM
jgi:hypothetical protein